MKSNSVILLAFLLLLSSLSEAQNFPKLSEADRLKKLEPPKSVIRMVLDTDTYNEIDDQFALSYALLSKERIQLEAVYAAPFLNNRSTSPGDGMEKSYEEILRLLKLLGKPADNFVYRGSDRYLEDVSSPIQSPAALDLIKRAMASSPDDPLYVVPVGCITS